MAVEITTASHAAARWFGLNDTAATQAIVMGRAVLAVAAHLPSMPAPPASTAATMHTPPQLPPPWHQNLQHNPPALGVLCIRSA